MTKDQNSENGVEKMCTNYYLFLHLSYIHDHTDERFWLIIYASHPMRASLCSNVASLHYSPQNESKGKSFEMTSAIYLQVGI